MTSPIKHSQSDDQAFGLTDEPAADGAAQTPPHRKWRRRFGAGGIAVVTAGALAGVLAIGIGSRHQSVGGAAASPGLEISSATVPPGPGGAWTFSGPVDTVEEVDLKPGSYVLSLQMNPPATDCAWNLSMPAVPTAISKGRNPENIYHTNVQGTGTPLFIVMRAERYDVDIDVSCPALVRLVWVNASVTPSRTGMAVPVSTPAASANGLTPPQVAALLRKTVRGVRPILLPTNVPAGWSASVQVWPTWYSVQYTDPAKPFASSIFLSVTPAYANDAPQTAAQFRGDLHARYTVVNPASGIEYLEWNEPGSWVDGPSGGSGVPYTLRVQGYTEPQFVQLADSLAVVQP